MKKRVIIIHCWDGYPKYCWYPSVKQKLEEKGYEVVIPTMPDTHAPQLNHWLPALQQAARKPNEQLYLVGHSAGCTILRYLEQLDPSQKMGGVVLVAGFTDDLGYSELKNFFTTAIDFNTIKTKAGWFVAIHSDNDPYVPLKHGGIFKKRLGAQLIVKHNMGHFSGPIDNTASTTTFPEVVGCFK